jgi:hypothetical protein
VYRFPNLKESKRPAKRLSLGKIMSLFSHSRVGWRANKEPGLCKVRTMESFLARTRTTQNGNGSKHRSEKTAQNGDIARQQRSPATRGLRAARSNGLQDLPANNEKSAQTKTKMPLLSSNLLRQRPPRARGRVAVNSNRSKKVRRNIQRLRRGSGERTGAVWRDRQPEAPAAHS